MSKIIFKDLQKVEVAALIALNVLVVATIWFIGYAIMQTATDPMFW